MPFVRTFARQQITVDVVLHFLLERCSEGLVLGDPVYSTTLLPGEQVRLFSSDRHTRWSYDSESNLTYRHETTSVESFYASGMARAMSDLTINESGSATSSYSESWAEGGGGLEISILGFINLGGGGGGGSYDASSMSAFNHSLSRHAESASSYVASSVRAKSSVSIGEVEKRFHAEGESEAQYEASSRMFSNPNKCRAITYLFYQINKIQNVRFTLEKIERRIDDPTAPTGAYQRTPPDITGRLTVIPQGVPATSKNRIELEDNARRSSISRQQEASNIQSKYQSGIYLATQLSDASSRPVNSRARKMVLEEVDNELIDAGIIDAKTKEANQDYVSQLHWNKQEILPTPGMLVKGCLDECQTCEPALQREIELDLEKKKLENEMLKKQIDLLEKSQEYRCCPSDGETTEPLEV
ncbi:hypothetical protein ACFLYQ_05530 [Chloroflexota bacterium]